MPETRLPDGALMAQKDAPVGGQAVLEGVMMRGVSTWAVAVRNPAGQIEISSESLLPWAQRHRLWRLPILRGIVALGESLKIGFKALAISANAQLEEDEKGEAEEIGGWVWGLTIALSLALAIGLVVLGFAGLVRPTRLGAGLTFGLGIALLLNHGGFLAYLFDPQIAGNPETGLLVGVGAGALATLGGLVSMATRAKRPAVAA